MAAFAAVCAFGGVAAAQPYVEEARFSQPSPETDTLTSVVALDGDTAVLASVEQLLNPTRRPGAVFVYRKANGQWAQEQRLVDAASMHNDDFGRAVAIEGNTLVVGASAGCISGRGGFSIFERTGTTWTLQRAYTAAGSDDQCLGMSVGLAGDMAVASAPNPGTTSVLVVRRVNGAWGDVQRVSPTVGSQRFSYGASVDMSGDTMCVMSRSGAGTALIDVFTRSGNAWTLQQGIVPPATAAGFQDMSCSVDGDSLVAGIRSFSTSSAPTGQFVGIAHVYVRSNGVWSLQQTLPGPGTAGAEFGRSVSVRGDELVVAARGQQVAHVYRRNAGFWTLAQSIAKVTANPSTIPSAVNVSLAASGLMVGQAGQSHGVYVRSSAPTVPGAPINFTATVTGNTINMAWGVPAAGSPVTSYTLVARTAPGATPVAVLPLGNVTSFGVTGPNGTFVLSVRGVNAQGEGPESTPLTVTLPGGAVAPPAAPTGLGVSVSGTTATFTWTAPTAGGAPTGYVLLAGTSPAFGAPIATLPLPASPASVSIPSVPPGTYYVRLISQNAAGSSGPSNEVPLTVAGATAPGAPTLSLASVSGSTVSMSWTPGTGSTTSYTLRAFTAGAAPIASVPGLTGTSASFTGVPAGTYLLDLVAVNAAGSSPASNRITLVVP